MESMVGNQRGSTQTRGIRNKVWTDPLIGGTAVAFVVDYKRSQRSTRSRNDYGEQNTPRFKGFHSRLEKSHFSHPVQLGRILSEVGSDRTL